MAGKAGNSSGAAAALQQLLTDRLRLLGPEHPDTLSTRHDLARWQGEGGDPDGAAAALEQLVIDCLKVLGSQHPYTLKTRRALESYGLNTCDQHDIGVNGVIG